MEFFKGLITGAVLTFIVCYVLNKGHTTGGYLYIFHQTIHGTTFAWSWPLFAVSTILGWALFAMTPK